MRGGGTDSDRGQKQTASALATLIRERRSVRAYTGEPLTEQQVRALVDALVWAPSSGNLQARKFFFVTRPELRQRLVDACFDHAWMAQAPLLVVGCTHARIKETYGEAGLETFAVMDISASVQNLLLTAHELGLGACWVCAFPPPKIAEIMELSPELRPVLLITVGRAAERPPVPERIPLGDAVEFID